MRTAQDKAANASFTLYVSQELGANIRTNAQVRELSINQYLKYLVLTGRGEVKADHVEIAEWVRGR